MNTLTKLIAAAAVALPLTTMSAPASANDGTWQNETVCLIPVDGLRDQPMRPVSLPDWEYVPAGTVNAGSTAIGAVGCAPLVCPDDLFMVSGTCMTEDPFADIPVVVAVPSSDPSSVDNPSRLDPPQATDHAPVAVLTVDVGPLVEPAIIDAPRLPANPTENTTP